MTNIKSHDRPPLLIFVTFLLGAAIAFFCYFLQNCTDLLRPVVEVISFKQSVEAGTWEADLRNLPQGAYFVSAGRPRGFCSITSNENELATINQIDSGARFPLMLGSVVNVVIPGESTVIKVKCKSAQGFSSLLTEQPLIAKYAVGVTIHLIRTLNDLIIGPVLCLILLIVSLFNRFTTGGLDHNGKNSRISTRTIIFSVVALIYSLSLAHITRLFMGQDMATVTHIAFRNLFGFVGLLMFLNRSRSSQWIIGFQTVVIISEMVAIVFAPMSTVLSIYEAQIFAFSITTAYVAFDRIREGVRSQQDFAANSFIVAWSITQFFDLVVLHLGEGVHLAPGMLWALTCLSIYVVFSEMKKQEFEAGIYQRLSLSLPRVNSTVDLVTTAASEFESIVKDAKVTAYIDSYELGESTSPMLEFVKVFPHRSNEEASGRVDFSLGFGKLMHTAATSGQPAISEDQDEKLFAVIPIGNLACINISEKDRSSALSRMAARERLTDIIPFASALDSRIRQLQSSTSAKIIEMRRIFGDGNSEMHIASIFIDVCDYTKQIEHHGSKYADFIAQKYFPALVESLPKGCFLESTRGDEAYIIIPQNNLGDLVGMSNSIHKCLSSLDDFFLNEGVTMAAANGFPAVRFRIGVSAGLATLNLGDALATTTGSRVFTAKRLQEVALPDQTLIDMDIKWPPIISSICGETEVYLVKKNVIRGAPIFIQSKSSKSA